MENLSDLRKAIEAINSKFGGGTQNPIQREVFKQTDTAVNDNEFASLVQSFAENSIRTFQHIKTNVIMKALMDHLDYNRYEFVIANFKYRYSEMDIFASVNNRVIEFEVKISLQDYAHDFKKVYQYGSYFIKNKPTIKKHALLRSKEEGIPDKAGKIQMAFPNFFYFVCPEGMLTREDVPDYCGLIVAKLVKEVDWKEIRSTANGKEPLLLDNVKFEILKTAPLLRSAFMPPEIYKVIATKCYNRYRQHLDIASLKDNDAPKT